MDERGRKISEGLKKTFADGRKGQPRSEETRQKIGAKIKAARASSNWPAWNRGLTKEDHQSIQSITEKPTERWQDPIAARKLARWQSPNGVEVRLGELLVPFGFDFVGSGQFIINGMRPDFWDGGTKLIEMYGNYWHKGDNPQDRIDLFKAEGYDCIVIWEHELKDPDTVIARVSDFAGAA